MIHVLLADSDAALAFAISRSLAHFGIEVVACSSPGATRLCLEEQRFDLVIVDYRWQSALRRDGTSAGKEPPVVFTTSFLGPREGRRLVQGLMLLLKPFSSVELLTIIRRELALHSPPVSTIDALRCAHAHGETVCLRDRSLAGHASAGDSRIYLDRGELVHAVFGSLEGVAALREILLRRAPVVTSSADVAKVRSIHQPLKALIFAILQELDTLPSGAPPPFSRVHRLETVDD
jgi:DNA-binding response OmpR family regulator